MMMPGSEFFRCTLSSSNDMGIVNASKGIICTISTAKTNTLRPAKRTGRSPWAEEPDHDADQHGDEGDDEAVRCRCGRSGRAAPR